MARIGLHSRHESRLQGPVDSGAWTNARTEVRVANHAIPDAEGKAMLAALEQGNPERAAEILAASTGMDSTQATQVVATIQAQRHR
ncbi:MAG: hypothetical protein SFU85_05570 [Candidatus Methylacidiphilales bacterium]|nr:hypothetical protein [Candidatus Methylacidiphilales bacterium]